MDNSFLILLQLLLAHILTDFVLQPTSWVKHKQRHILTSGYLYIHSFIAGLLTYLLLGKWRLWYIAILISVTHFFIDVWKLKQKKDNLKIFLLDQLYHVAVIVVVWLFLTANLDQVFPFLKYIFHSTAFITVVTAYLIIIFPAGFIIGKATRRWQKEVDSIENSFGLQDAGRYIGIFERLLVLTFILTGNFSAIGFLIAAKSILRFNDKAEIGARKQTEYVLIGTLMSFTITIIVGLLVNHIAF